MTQNIMNLWGEIVWIGGGIAVLLAFGLALALPHVARRRPASEGHRAKEDETVHEESTADGFIDSYAKDIEEAGGGLPPIMKLATPVVLLWWLGYLVLNWVPGLGLW
jgi:hypothetical protein